MDTGFSRARIDPDPGERFVSLRRDLGVSSFGLNELVLEPGQRGRIHRHREQEEVYLVLEGTLTLVIEGEEQTLERGDLIRVAPELRRQVVNKGPARLILIALGGAGEHQGRDGLAYVDWDSSDDEARPPQETPMPSDWSSSYAASVTASASASARALAGSSSHAVAVAPTAAIAAATISAWWRPST